jgi:hypothetical protein
VFEDGDAASQLRISIPKRLAPRPLSIYPPSSTKERYSEARCPSKRKSMIPERLTPDRLMTALSEPILLRDHGLSLRLSENQSPLSLEGTLRLRWNPSTAVEFTGQCPGFPFFELPDSAALLFSEPTAQCDVFVTSAAGPQIRCVLRSHADLAWTADAVDRVTFYLVNFPEYLGLPIRFDNGAKQGGFRGRLELFGENLVCRVDAIPEHDELRTQAMRDAGYVLSHFCELLPAVPLSQGDVGAVLEILHLFFGFLRGAWSGPVLPRGYHAGSLVWEQIANWAVDDPVGRPTWLPELSPLT